MTELEELRSARRNFWAWSLGSLALAFISHLLGQRIHTPLLRLALVAAFFTGLSSAVWSLTAPLAAYLRAHYAMRYRDAGLDVIATSNRIASETERLARSFTTPLHALIGILALRVLSWWPQFAALAPIRRFLPWAFVGALVWAIWLVFASKDRVVRLSSIRTGMRSQMDVAGLRPLSAADYEDEAACLGGPPVVLLDHERFQVAGIPWTWSEFRTNAVIFGQTGSGKTITVLNSFLEALLANSAPARSKLPAAALILDPKGDFKDKIARLCARHGREGDLLVFDPASPSESATWNPLDATQDDELELAGRFVEVLRLLGMKAGDDTFFIDQAKLFLRHSIALLRASSLSGALPSLAEIYSLSQQASALDAHLLLLNLTAAVRRAAPNPDLRLGHLIEKAGNPATMKMVLDSIKGGDAASHAQRAFFERIDMMSERDSRSMIAALETLIATNADRPLPADLGPAPVDSQNFFLNAWLTLPDKTRDNVRGQLSNMLDPFLIEPFRRLLSGRSTVDMGRVLEEGKIFYVHMPSADRPEMSRTLNTLIKLSFFREVRRRVNKARPSLFFCDEFQDFFTADGESGSDVRFFETSRQSNHASVIATQSMSSLKRGANGDATVDRLVANCGTKVFLRNSDPSTNQCAEALGGTTKQVDLSIGQTMDQGRDRQQLAGGYSVNETVKDTPRFPRDLFPRLAIPTLAPGQDYSEAIVDLGGRQPREMRRLRFRVNPL